MLFHDIVAKSRDWIDFPETDPILDLLGPDYADVRLKDLNIYFQGCSEAVPFVLDDNAIDLIESIESTDEDILSLAREIHLPFNKCWFEFQLIDEEEQRSCRYGCLISYMKTGERMFLVFVDIGNHKFIEPFYIFKPNGKSKNGLYFAPTMRSFLAKIHDIQPYFNATGLYDSMLDNTLIVVRFVVNAILLMNSKDSPISAKSEQSLSRQARRAMSRKSETDSGTLSNVTRICLNEIGREHVRLLSEEALAHPERRTHLVRGHLMRTGAGKAVWRRSHIRGNGTVAETLRMVSAGVLRKTEIAE